MSLPSGYKRLEYIESTGTQYIDTRVSGGTNASFEMAARLVRTNSKNNNQFFGTVSNFCSVNGTSSYFRVEKKYSTGAVVNFTTTPATKWNLKVESDGSVYLDGALKGTISSIAGIGWGGDTYSNNIFITDDDGINYATSAELYLLKMYTDGVLVRDFIPAKRLSDNAIGLYDNVGKKFYANAGTGTFTAGPVIAIAASESEITEIEYIQSSGTQYIDTVVPVKSTSGFEVSFAMTDTSGRIGVIGGFTYGGYNHNFAAHDGKWITQYGNNEGYQFGSVDTERHTVSQNVKSGTVYFDGETIKTGLTYYDNTSRTFRLFCYNGGDSYPTFWIGALKLYSCKIYDNGILVRDYIAAKLYDGTVGLYDKLNGLLYINVGSGAFTAGPEVQKTPPTPTGFAASMLTDTTVKLSWAASDGATGYKLYKNDALLATLTDTSYTDTVQIFSGTVYAVTAYNDYGESAAAELTYCSIPENPILYLVTDRTESDVAYVKLLYDKGLVGMSDVEKAEWLSGLKGSYNALDLNRVESAVDYVARRLQIFGNAVEVYTKKDWATKDVPNVSAMKRYLDDVAALRTVLSVLPTTPEVPPDMDGLTYNEANNIEQILKDIDLLINNMTAAWFYSYDLYAGEV